MMQDSCRKLWTKNVELLKQKIYFEISRKISSRTNKFCTRTTPNWVNIAWGKFYRLKKIVIIFVLPKVADAFKLVNVFKLAVDFKLKFLKY